MITDALAGTWQLPVFWFFAGLAVWALMVAAFEAWHNHRKGGK